MTNPRSGLGTTPNEDPAFAGLIDLPYTLSAGRAAGTFLAELAHRRIVGSRCGGCGLTHVPAQDFCGACGGEPETLMAMPSHGVLTGFTETAAGVIGCVKIDQSDTDMVHRILDATYAELEIGATVVARWAAEPAGSILDIEGFVPAEPGPEHDAPADLDRPADLLPEIPYGLELHYRHSYGPYYGRLFDELASTRRIQGVRCPSCLSVLVPPREYCEACFTRTAEWVDVPDTGVLQAFSIIHLAFVGQMREPPYIYGEIILDGAATRLIHVIGGISPEDAVVRLAPGQRVRAVWTDAEPKGTLEDILHFEPIADG